ncbi:MAG: efflux RND transporter periplasmic adaptor subunit [Verrucomicrobiota bacterium]
MNNEQAEIEKVVTTKQRFKGKRWALVGVLGVMGIGLLATRGWGGDDRAPDEGQAAMRVLAVETVGVDLVDSYEVRDRFVGRAEAARSSLLGFELAGTVEAVAVDDGVRVESGQVLARLDTARLEARRGELVASMEQFEATRDLAQSTYDRTDQAVGKGAISRQELDEAAERVRTSEALVRRMKAQIEAIDVDLAKSQLVAPYDGTIAAREVDEGAIVSAGQGVLQLLETDRLEVRVGLSSGAAGGVTRGDALLMKTADGGEVGGVVERILPQRDARVRTVEIVLGLTDGEKGVVRDGDLLEVSLGRRVEERGAWLPRTALTESARGLWGAYVAEREGDWHVLERRQLEVIDEAGAEVYVRGALGEGERVVASGLHRLSPGQRVNVMNLPGDDEDAGAGLTAVRRAGGGGSEGKGMLRPLN